MNIFWKRSRPHVQPTAIDCRTGAGGGGGALAFEAPLQKEQDRHWQRGQWAPALFSEQNLAQLSTLMSPGKVELQAAPVVVAAEATLAAAASSTSNRMPIGPGRSLRAQQAAGALCWRQPKLLAH